MTRPVDLLAENARLRAVLELALRYLDHPDVQAIPFALHASVVADRARHILYPPRCLCGAYDHENGACLREVQS